MGRPKKYVESRVQKPVRLPRDLDVEAMAEAYRRQVSWNYIVETALRDWLKRNRRRA